MVELCAAALFAVAMPADSSFAVYDGQGRPAALDDVCLAAGAADVVFLGEIHNDPTAHALQLALFHAVAEDARGAYRRPLALGLEMFETDVQLVLDEYAAGLIRERDFLAAARPWERYPTDYRPLVEAAREAGAAVLATNAPKRYVSRVATEGVAWLDSLGAAALATLPPRPIAPASEATTAAFAEVMGGMGMGHGHGGPTLATMLDAQNLRDASMAQVVAGWLAAHERGLVVHVNGSFHSEAGRGIPEHLARLAPAARALTVTMRPAADVAASPGPSGDDFVVLTDAALVPAGR